MKIIFATDGSECSHRAIEFIRQRPWKKDDCFEVVMVVNEQIAVLILGAPAGVTSDVDMRKEAAKITSRGAEEIRAILPDNTVESKVLTGPVAETICDYALQSDTDLIIMGSHGRQGFKHFLIGSVAEEVLKQAPCSIEIIKNKKEIRDNEQEASSENVASS